MKSNQLSRPILNHRKTPLKLTKENLPLKPMSMIECLQAEDLVTILTKSFYADQMMKFCEINSNYCFKGNYLEVNSNNSLLLEFNKLNKQPTYRLLLLLHLADSTHFSTVLHHDLLKIRDSKIDKIAILSLVNIEAAQIAVLRSMQVTVLHISDEELHEKQAINHFLPLNNCEHHYAIYANRIANSLTKRLKKIFHLVLSEMAAQSYDTKYASSRNLGTKSFMEFEEKNIDKFIEEYLKKGIKDEKIVVDVGCGTGRHSLRIASFFDQVYGYDFSPKMINVAKQKKNSNPQFDHCLFCEADVEFEQLRYEADIKGKTDLVLASFGMGSFVEDTETMIKRYYDWLKPGGRIYISFYNSNSILLNVIPNWRNTSLSARIDVSSNTLEVHLEKNVAFQIFCRPFDQEIARMLKKYFTTINLFSYPTMMALMPNGLLQNEIALKLFSDVDADLADKPQHQMGHYILFFGEKKCNP